MTLKGETVRNVESSTGEAAIERGNPAARLNGGEATPVGLQDGEVLDLRFGPTDGLNSRHIFITMLEAEDGLKMPAILDSGTHQYGSLNQIDLDLPKDSKGEAPIVFTIGENNMDHIVVTKGDPDPTPIPDRMIKGIYWRADDRLRIVALGEDEQKRPIQDFEGLWVGVIGEDDVQEILS